MILIIHFSFVINLEFSAIEWRKSDWCVGYDGRRKTRMDPRSFRSGVAEHLGRYSVFASLVGGRTGGHRADRGHHSAGLHSDHVDNPVHVGHLHERRSQRRCVNS